MHPTNEQLNAIRLQVLGELVETFNGLDGRQELVRNIARAQAMIRAAYEMNEEDLMTNCNIAFLGFLTVWLAVTESDN